MIRRLLSAPFRMISRLMGGTRRTRTTRTVPRTTARPTTVHRPVI